VQVYGLIRRIKNLDPLPKSVVAARAVHNLCDDDLRVRHGGEPKHNESAKRWQPAGQAVPDAIVVRHSLSFYVYHRETPAETSDVEATSAVVLAASARHYAVAL
jgi:hypothetical protein